LKEVEQGLGKKKSKEKKRKEKEKKWSRPSGESRGYQATAGANPQAFPSHRE
jgi:hypothetical protein